MPDYAVSSLAYLLRFVGVRPVTWMLVHSMYSTLPEALLSRMHTHV